MKAQIILNDKSKTPLEVTIDNDKVTIQQGKEVITLQWWDLRDLTNKINGLQGGI